MDRLRCFLGRHAWMNTQFWVYHIGRTGGPPNFWINRRTCTRPGCRTERWG